MTATCPRCGLTADRVGGAALVSAIDQGWPEAGDGTEPATPPSGGYYMVSMRDVLRALDGGAS